MKKCKKKENSLTGLG